MIKKVSFRKPKPCEIIAFFLLVSVIVAVTCFVTRQSGYYAVKTLVGSVATLAFVFLLVPTTVLLADETRKMGTLAVLVLMVMPTIMPNFVPPTIPVPDTRQEGLTLVYEDKMTFKTATTIVSFWRDSNSMWLITIVVDQRWGTLKSYTTTANFRGYNVKLTDDGCYSTYYGWNPRDGDTAYENHVRKVGKSGAWLEWDSGKCYGWFHKDQYWGTCAWSPSSTAYSRRWTFSGTAPDTWNLRTAVACSVERPSYIGAVIHCEVWDGWCMMWHLVETIDYTVGIRW